MVGCSYVRWCGSGRVVFCVVFEAVCTRTTYGLCVSLRRVMFNKRSQARTHSGVNLVCVVDTLLHGTLYTQRALQLSVVLALGLRL
jgi:hypothetical protein